MISIDNSVELMMQTYLQLPKRVTGVSISRTERENYCRNFPSLLDGIEQHAAEKIVGFDLGHIEWFHRLRNQLYHDGNGLTVERAKVEVYAELAQRLFEALFGVALEVPDTDNMRRYGEFIDTWAKIERHLRDVPETERRFPTTRTLMKLQADGKISQSEFAKFEEVRNVRNKLVHGEIEPETTLSSRIIEAAKEVLIVAARISMP
ncbi:hypothetical protein PhaeoP75_00473 [Phaeobacter gallaeciensis]|uniref:Uncharacterized protein n=2 Tax=Phaeobacter gallaeciensis TaxID=60890 RepID=A0AAD0EBR6_9RHOB|nr:hypothetical protein Gal_00475 [Phaeobacter gallaeciensis DSM 26640]ATE91533.1 hypothetical protein PhaeoP11_00472 [Phaeobacter gallaeciensis]ATE95809.1 hypothetical protein PhaeoP73_00473 [Phaeobacter gallaeciensis]ATF00149.1 hypothetical protein PhaeoP75_00473 [Phaeobacter gallaeciensis]ATF04581.1 hypothetical protein PhaeoP63_00473 [Phaeobacter gallaeciensis]